MKNHVIRKIKNRQGVSLTETLVALIFCLMTFALVCTAISAASRQLKALTMHSEAKMLCSTLTTAVEDELRFAQNVAGSDIDSIVYDNSGRASSNAVRVSFINDNGNIKLQDSASSDTDAAKYILIPAANYTQGIKASLQLYWSNKCFTGMVTVTDSSDNELCSQSFAVRPMNY